MRRTIPMTDPLLIEQARQGCLASFEELVRQNSHWVYNLALRLTGSAADAADVAQEAWVKIYRNIGRYRGEAAFSTWVYRIVVNTCLGERRRWRHWRSPQALTPAAENLLGGAPCDGLERIELQVGIGAALDQLPETQRTLIVLRDIEDCTYREIAVLLGWTPTLVKSRLHRARQRLRVLLECGANADSSLAAVGCGSAGRAVGLRQATMTRRG
jgi:RNA polymerase sigma-70 factor (ECF subfamily)